MACAMSRGESTRRGVGHPESAVKKAGKASLPMAGEREGGAHEYQTPHRFRARWKERNLSGDPICPKSTINIDPCIFITEFGCQNIDLMGR